MGRKLEAPAIEGHELDGGMLKVEVLIEARETAVVILSPRPE
jgi:hypothetical protein